MGETVPHLLDDNAAVDASVVGDQFQWVAESFAHDLSPDPLLLVVQGGCNAVDFLCQLQQSRAAPCHDSFLHGSLHYGFSLGFN